MGLGGGPLGLDGEVESPLALQAEFHEDEVEGHEAAGEVHVV